MYLNLFFKILNKCSLINRVFLSKHKSQWFLVFFCFKSIADNQLTELWFHSITFDLKLVDYSIKVSGCETLLYGN